MQNLHKNAVTGQVYQGGNQKMLGIDAMIAGFTSNEWATFLQWKQAGFMVKKGQKAGGRIVKFIAVTEKKKNKAGKDVYSEGKRPRGYAVFNRDQVAPITQMETRARV